MKILKHLGLIVMLATALVLVLSYFYGWSNNNSITMGSLGIMILGLPARLSSSSRLALSMILLL